MKRKSRFGFISRIGLLNLLLLIAVPSVVVASVVVAYSYPNSVAAQSDQIYLAQGPNYAAANSLNMITATQTSVTTGSTTVNEVTSTTTIQFGSSAGGGTVYMLNVLKIVNATSLPANTNVFVWINGTLPSGVTLFYSAIPMSFTGSAVTNATLSGASVSSLASPGSPATAFSAQVHLYGASQTVLYIGFEVTSAATGTGTMTLQYQM